MHEDRDNQGATEKRSDVKRYHRTIDELACALVRIRQFGTHRGNVNSLSLPVGQKAASRQHCRALASWDPCQLLIVPAGYGPSRRDRARLTLREGGLVV